MTQIMWLHGFATGPQVWHNQKAGQAPKISFSDLNKEGERIADELVGGTVLVGWSMGGMVALRAAEIGQSRIKALVLVSTTPKFIKSADFPYGLPLVLLRRLEKRIGREGTKAFHDLIFKNGETLGLVHLKLNEVKEDLKQLERVDLRASLAKIRVPTLIIHGDQDEICLPGAAEYMQAKIQNSKLEIMPGIGHAPMIEAPEKFNAMLDDFINEHTQ